MSLSIVDNGTFGGGAVVAVTFLNTRTLNALCLLEKDRFRFDQAVEYHYSRKLVKLFFDFLFINFFSHHLETKRTYVTLRYVTYLFN